jgi:hypothetical protein
MKIRLQKSGRDEAGMATIVVIALISVLLIFVAGNLRTLYLLRNDLKLIEKQQTSRLVTAGPITNSPSLINAAPGAGDTRPPPGQQPK